MLCPVYSSLCSLDVENGVGRVHRSLVLCGLTNQSFLFSEGDERRSGEATLLVGDCSSCQLMRLRPVSCLLTDFDIVALIGSNA